MSALTRVPTFVGFDSFFNDMDAALSGKASNFPPHNVVKVGDHRYTLEIAIAGYDKDSIKVSVEGDNLTVAAEKAADLTGEYVHRGISSRAVRKHFKLADHMVVTDDATYENGLLTIQLAEEVPEKDKPKLISIR